MIEKLYDRHPRAVTAGLVLLVVLMSVAFEAAWGQMDPIERAAWIIANGRGR